MPTGSLDAVLSVDGEEARQRVDDLAVGGKVDDLARVDDAAHVDRRHLAIVAGDGDDGAIVGAANVVAGDADVRRRETWKPAIRSAFSVAASIDLIVSSRSTTTPLRIPMDGASPTPTISSPFGPSTATTAHGLGRSDIEPANGLVLHLPRHLSPQLWTPVSAIYCGNRGRLLLHVAGADGHAHALAGAGLSP